MATLFVPCCRHRWTSCRVRAFLLISIVSDTSRPCINRPVLINTPSPAEFLMMPEEVCRCAQAFSRASASSRRAWPRIASMPWTKRSSASASAHLFRSRSCATTRSPRDMWLVKPFGKDFWARAREISETARRVPLMSAPTMSPPPCPHANSWGLASPCAISFSATSRQALPRASTA